ncbi:MAG: hypothetical protein ACI9W6_000973 [Motiliproteus sp.]
MNAEVGTDSAGSLIPGAGVKVNQSLSDELLLVANAGVSYDVITEYSSLTPSLAGGGANFTTEGMTSDEVVYNAGLGAAYSLVTGTEITTKDTLNVRQDYTDQAVSVNFKTMLNRLVLCC